MGMIITETGNPTADLLLKIIVAIGCVLAGGYVIVTPIAGLYSGERGLCRCACVLLALGLLCMALIVAHMTLSF